MRRVYAMASRWAAVAFWAMALGACGDRAGTDLPRPDAPGGTEIGSRTTDGGAGEAGLAARDGSGAGDLCRCPAGSPVARLPLACLCASPVSAGICSSHLADVADGSGACDSEAATVVRTTGCGRVRFGRIDIVFAGEDSIFDPATGSLVGVLAFSDIPVVTCGARQVLYGQGLFPMANNDSLIAPGDVCLEVDSCTVCGRAQNAPPPCP